MGGGDSKFLVPVSPQWGWSRMGGTWKKSDWSQNCPLNAKLGHFCYFKHEIQLFKVLLNLKVFKFDTKMHLNLSNFQGRTSAGGGKSLGPKMGTSVGWGGFTIFLPDGGPQSPQEKTCKVLFLMTLHYTTSTYRKNKTEEMHLGKTWVTWVTSWMLGYNTPVSQLLYTLFMTTMAIPSQCCTNCSGEWRCFANYTSFIVDVCVV